MAHRIIGRRRLFFLSQKTGRRLFRPPGDRKPLICCVVTIRRGLGRFEVHAGEFARLMEFRNGLQHGYIEMSAPWKLAKERSTVGSIGSGAIRARRVVANSSAFYDLSYFANCSTRSCVYQLNLQKEPHRIRRGTGAGLPVDEHHLGKPVPLFPRIETE
jgi:methionyl-tRNA synthetase